MLVHVYTRRAAREKRHLDAGHAAPSLEERLIEQTNKRDSDLRDMIVHACGGMLLLLSTGELQPLTER